MTTSLSGRRSQARTGGAAIERQIDQALEQIKADRDATQDAARARAAADKQLEGTHTRTSIADARAVRDSTGWHRVLRINPTTVVVPGPWGGERRIPINRIREARA